MNFIIFQIILYTILLYINYLSYRWINKLNIKLSKYETMIYESNMKIIKITNILLNIHKKNIEFTDIKLEELEENLINKITFSNYNYGSAKTVLSS
jgi:hypothetical protein